MYLSRTRTMDTQKEPFLKNHKVLGLGRQIGQINLLRYFGSVSPLSMFFNIQPLFLQKTKPLYPHSKYLFGIGTYLNLNLGRKELGI